MMRALYSAASGMMAQQLNIDNISHNLANVQSTAYKKSRVEFQDLLYAQMETPEAEATGGVQVGMGTRAVTTQQLFTQGSLKASGNNFDVAIQGNGFFQVSLPDGKTAYTRDGALKMDGEGNLLAAGGYNLGIKIPKDITDIKIETDGKITGIPISSTSRVEIGQLKLSRFLNPAGLKAIGGNLYLATKISGEKVEDKPGANGLGALAQGYLEESNVNVVEEMINIIQAQRTYELNSKSVQAADEMERQAAQIKKS